MATIITNFKLKEHIYNYASLSHSLVDTTILQSKLSEFLPQGNGKTESSTVTNMIQQTREGYEEE